MSDEANNPAQVDGFDLIAEILASRGRLSEAASERVRDAVRAYVYTLGAQRVDEGLGLVALPGGRSIAYRLAASKQMSAIAAAWRAMADCSALSTWRRCEILASEIADFEALYWPRWKDSGPPEGSSALRCALFEAFAALDRAPPRTAKGLAELLKRAGALT